MFFNRSISANLFLVFSLSILPLFSGCSSQEEDSKQKQAQSKPAKIPGYEDVLILKVKALSPVVSEMSGAFGFLHPEYPKQIAFWNDLHRKLPDGDPLKKQMESLLSRAAPLLLSVSSYADEYAKVRGEIEKEMSEQKTMSRKELVGYHARLGMLLHLQEKLGYYEFASQGMLERLYQITSERWDEDQGGEIYLKNETFEKFRQAQVAKYRQARKSFAVVEQPFAALERGINFKLRGSFLSNATHYLRLAESLSTNSLSGKNYTASDEPTASVSRELAQIARNKMLEFRAVEAALSDSYEGEFRSLLYAPLSSEKSGNESAEGVGQNEMARRLIQSLEAMRPELTSLVDILVTRNQALNKLSLIENESFSWFKESIEIEDVRLERLEAVILEIGVRRLPPREAVGDIAFSTLYEELGHLQEEISSLEVLILQELASLAKNSALFSEPRWPVIGKLIEKENLWQQNWAGRYSDWKEAIEQFRRYQKSLLVRYMDALVRLQDGLVPILEDTDPSGDTMTEQFLELIDTEISTRLKETRSILRIKKEMTLREADDPLFAALFGVRPERFWHDFRGQGPAFSDPERLVASQTNLMGQLRTMQDADLAPPMRTILMLRIAADLGLIQDLDRDEKGIFVRFRSAGKGLILEGLTGNFSPELRQISTEQQARERSPEYMRVLTLLLPLREAHAGLIEKAGTELNEYGTTVFSQYWKNKTSYLLGGAAVVGGWFLGGPIGGVLATAAVAALKIQVAADTGIGATRYIVNQHPDPEWKKTLTTGIDGVETAYNIGKVFEGVTSVGQATKAAEESAQATDEAAKLVKQGIKAWERGDDLLRQGDAMLDAATKQPNLLPRVQQALLNVREEFVRAGYAAQGEAIKAGEEAIREAARMQRLGRMTMGKGEKLAEGIGVETAAETAGEMVVQTVRGLINLWTGPEVKPADTAPPVVRPPGDINKIEATGPTTVVPLGTATAFDKVDGVLIPVPNQTGPFSMGTHKIIWRATDAAGNIGSAEQKIGVVDTTRPSLSNVPVDITVEATSASGAMVKYTPPTATDAADPAPAVSCSPSQSSIFPLGATTVSCTATDASGNRSEDGSFTLVVEDTRPPWFATKLTDITAEATSASGAVVRYPWPGASDTVDPKPIVSCAPFPGETFRVGVTSVSCVATDASGNSSGVGRFKVVVKKTSPVQLPVTENDCTGENWQPNCDANVTQPGTRPTPTQVAQAGGKADENIQAIPTDRASTGSGGKPGIDVPESYTGGPAGPQKGAEADNVDRLGMPDGRPGARPDDGSITEQFGNPDNAMPPTGSISREPARPLSRDRQEPSTPATGSRSRPASGASTPSMQASRHGPSKPPSGRPARPTRPSASSPTRSPAPSQPGLAKACAAGYRMIIIGSHGTREDENGNEVIMDARSTMAQMASALRLYTPPQFRRRLGSARVVGETLSWNGAVNTAKHTCSYPTYELLMKAGQRSPTGTMPPKKRPDGTYSCCTIFGARFDQIKRPYYVYEQKFVQ